MHAEICADASTTMHTRGRDENNFVRRRMMDEVRRRRLSFV